MHYIFTILQKYIYIYIYIFKPTSETSIWRLKSMLHIHIGLLIKKITLSQAFLGWFSFTKPTSFKKNFKSNFLGTSWQLLKPAKLNISQRQVLRVENAKISYQFNKFFLSQFHVCNMYRLVTVNSSIFTMTKISSTQLFLISKQLSFLNGHKQNSVIVSLCPA